MKRVIIAPRIAAFGLAALTFFAAGGLVIAVLLLVGAENVARANGSSPLAVRITGALLGTFGALVLWRALLQWRAVATIYVDHDGWCLADRLGRLAPIDAGTAVTLSLRCRRVVYSWGGAPRIQDVVDGTLTAAGRTRRLAPSGRFTYARVLTDLGISGSPPERGRDIRYTAQT